MNSNSDEAFEKFKNYDFADAKPVSDVPVLAHLQAESCMLLDKGHETVGWTKPLRGGIAFLSHTTYPAPSSPRC